jgi:hypothetical protein
MRGTVLCADDAGYDEARGVFNGRFDRRPAAIARCASVEDVQTVLGVARDGGLRVSIRSGGHDFAGNSASDGGLVIDVGPLNHVRIDRNTKTARVGAGATWGVFRSRGAGTRSGHSGADRVHCRSRRQHPRWRHRVSHPSLRSERR